MTALDDARAYIGAAYGPTYTAWLTLSDDDASRTLVSATRYLDQQPWQGKATGIGEDGSPTTLQWPRSGVVVGGVAIDSTTIPTEITEATFELAVMIAASPGLVNKLDQGSNVQAANAGGGTGVAFFAPTSARNGTATVLPPMIQRMVGKFLASATSSTSEGSAGVGIACSSFSSDAAFTLARPS